MGIHVDPARLDARPIRPSIRAMFTERRTYLRPLNEDGTEFETPAQAHERIIGHQRWLWEQAQGRPLDLLQEAELAELGHLMKQKKISVSGRVKWMGGTDLVKERAAACFNCFGVETAFITDKGVRRFSDFVDGEEVTVWTHKGRWRKAVVRSYGRQALNKIVFGRTKTNIEVRATGNHRWLLDGDKGETTALKVGDRIARPLSSFSTWNFDDAPVDEQLYWAYGFVYGDGTLTKRSGVATGSMVRLCGEKAKYLNRFTDLGFDHSFPPSCDNDPFVYTGKYLKTTPSTIDDPRLIRAFVHGYLNADGHKAAGFASVYSQISATSSDAQSFIREFFPVAGVFVASERKMPDETNFGKRSNETVMFNIFDTCGEATNSSFNVRSIEPDNEEEVWCLEVEEDRSFTLPNGIVTGNCTFSLAQRPADLVDIFWLLLQGSGVGFKPVTGLLTGLPASIEEVITIPSTRTEKGGAEDTVDWIDGDVWTIKIGDSAKAWAKALGVLTGHKPRVKTLVLDFSELRPGGKRLKGYGWLSSGWEPLEKGFLGIVKVLRRRADALLTRIDIGDIVNWLGTVLSSRRAAESWLEEVTETEWEAILEAHGDFIDAKTDRWEKGEGQREQSNNSLVFMNKPSRDVVVRLLHRILHTGEPGFVNGVAARIRAPEMEGLNPCFEILLADGACCNLFQNVWHRWNGDRKGMRRAQYLCGRANYRQTCVSMRDGVLQLKWNDNQKLLRLCGVSPTGYVAWEGLNDPERLEEARADAWAGANSMADELGQPRPRRVTQVQPAGTSSKALGLEGDEVHEGAHLAMSRWIFNNINFSKLDPIVEVLRKANYNVRPNPVDPTGVLVTFPVEYPESPLFTPEKRMIDGVEHHLEINRETAVSQLERYRHLMNHYVDNNCFTGSTRFLTAEKGLASFEDFTDGELVNVMNRDGRWTPATVKSFGEQKVWRVTVERARTKHIIETTAGHRWPVSSAQDRLKGREVWTTTDKLGDFIGKKNLITVLPNLGLDLDETAVLRGIVYGDGTLYNHPNMLAKVTLCGDIAKGQSKVDLLPLFEKAGYVGSPLTVKGYRTVHGLPAIWKRDLPCIKNSTPAELRGFIAGWFATDGSVSGGVATIGSTNLSDIEWLQQAGPKAGIAIMTDAKVVNRIGYNTEPKPFYSVVIAKASLDSSFFLLNWKKLDGDFGIKHWKIVSVEETERVEPVFCVVEPKAHEFVLEGNILTGNCSITVSFDEDEIEDIADWFMEHWDEYVGVSFLKRNDPNKTAADLGFAYLPQECVSRETFEAYASKLLPVDISGDQSEEMLDLGGCGVGVGSCPVR